MGVFKGIVQLENGKALLNANGVIVELDGDLTLFRSAEGSMITLKGDQMGNKILNAVPVNGKETVPSADDIDQSLQRILNTIKSEQEQLLTIPGVLAVRPGYSELPDTPKDDLLISVITVPGDEVSGVPDKINGIQVETRKATVLEQVEGIAPLSTWEDGTREAAPNIHYVPPDENTLSLKDLEVGNITCHVGPDAGWATLKTFLEGTKKSLTVAMYEFYADHIIKAVTALGEDEDLKLNMILQVNANDRETQKKLKKTWGDRLNFVAASVSGPNRLFNNSYHSKIAVRDSKSVWISSGNWSPSSQPVIKETTESNFYNKGNREWHVIIHDKKIAQMYEAFIRYDMEEAARVEGAEIAQVMPDLLVPESFFFPEAVVFQAEPFLPKTFGTDGDLIKVRPLMSPDNYAKGILKLIRSAKKSLYLQFSYVTLPATEIFDQIIDAVSEKMNDGIDVRVILGSFQKPSNNHILVGKRKWKRSMFRIQKSKLHNKGVIIDGKIAVVGSNNWSSDGTQYNRDTSLVFFSRPIAQYYNEVFLFDWDNLTKSITTSTEIAPVLAPETGPTPLGMVRIPWQAWFND